MHPDLRQPRASFHSLGCRVNQSETRAAAEELAALGYRIVPFGQPSDLCIVNTCSVTDQADAKSRAALRRGGRSGDAPLVIATGCYADLAPDAVAAITGVAAVVPNAQKPRLAQIAHDTLIRSGRLLFPLPEGAQFAAAGATGELINLAAGTGGPLGRTRATIKVQDGCNHFCSFCIIPFARGRLRSRPPAEVVEEARRFVSEGCLEIVLAGICLGDYGDERGSPDTGGDPLAALLCQLCRIPNLRRIRLSSIDPADLSHELVDAVGSLPPVCRHLHLSLQSGDDEVLGRMRRRYTAGDFLRLVNYIRKRVPGCALTCDVIAGFPGESSLQFEQTVQLCESASFARIHAFPYSPRPGTLAARWSDDVPRPEKDRRVRRLLDLSARLAHEFAAAHVGQVLEVLVEDRDPHTGRLSGLTDNYLRVDFRGPDDLRGHLINARAVSVSEAGILAELCVHRPERSSRPGGRPVPADRAAPVA